MYYFVNWRQAREGDGWEPDLPEDVPGYSLFFDPSNTADWAIFHCSFDDETEDRGSAVPVPDLLDGLIASGERYPPAIAITRNEVCQFNPVSIPGKSEFIEMCVKRLFHHLDCQGTASYFLAKATRHQMGYLCKDEYYWIVRYVNDEENPHSALWVSSDFCIYINPLSDFVIEKDALESLKANAAWPLKFSRRC
jgi:hypothetical protein